MSKRHRKRKDLLQILTIIGLWLVVIGQSMLLIIHIINILGGFN